MTRSGSAHKLAQRGQNIEETRFRYATGLDGIRALSVAAVVAYHLGTTSGATILPGGFLGVDIFFVLSGYLITTLLIVEVRTHGRISIKKFYIRRARRLLPALYTLLLAVGVVTVVWLPQQSARVRGDLLAALGYVTNWWLIAQNSSYFSPEGERPSPLTHLWSLAVEEQYYLIWPLILIGFAVIRANRAVMLVLVLAGIGASTAAGVLLFDPWADPSRVYYGTDTRALAPLIGAALAIAVRPWRHRRRLRAAARWSLDLLGVVALFALTVIAAVLHDTDEMLYLGGFAVIALLGAIVVGVGGHPGTMLGEALSFGPLRWLGERSYGIYLWHWPVCVLTRPGMDVPLAGWANVGLRIGLTLLLAETSYRLIEVPIRTHGFAAPVLAAIRRTPARHSRTVSRARVVHSLALAAVLLAVSGFVGVRLSGPPAPVAGGPIDTGPEATLGPLASPTVGPSGSSGPTPTAGPRPPRPTPVSVAFFGDSQGMTLLLNKPADLGTYLTTTDATIGGCGVLLGKVASRTGERRNLTANCPNWRSEWAADANRIKPSIAVIMIGAWDVFDLTVDSGTLTFGTAEWDAAFIEAVTAGVDVLRAAGATVAISLLPCYRPIKGSAGFWPERGDDTRTRHVNEVIRTVSAGYTGGVSTLDPPEEFCTDAAIGKNTAYRWDGVHYYKKGAALYFNTVVPQLLSL